MTLKNSEASKPGDLRVWWIPQIPGKPFHYPVDTVDQGAALLDALGKYDLFQLKNRIKPDYANAGGLQVFVEDDGEGRPGWVDWDDMDTGHDDPESWHEEMELPKPHELLAEMCQAYDGLKGFVAAIPAETPLPAMPGIDTDYFDQKRDQAETALSAGGHRKAW